MGQTIAVDAMVMGEAAVLTGNRSLTGQDGASFDSGAAADPAAGLPAALAARLFAADPEIGHVFVHSNAVVLRRAGGWPDGTIGEARQVVADFFVYYRNDAGDEPPVGGVGRGLAVRPAARPVVDEATAAALRAEHYNATISYLRRAHDDLWIFGVEPDGGVPPYDAGQYATLGLGYWEPRIDDLAEELSAEQAAKLARRSYSISSPILGDDGELLPAGPEPALEFYVVLVEADWQGTPAVLTPRLFLKDVGERLYMGRKIAGRYRLDRMDDPDADVFLLSTGTGEAPHNRMTLDLLRDGHRGRIVAACTARYRRDLAYLDTQRELERRFPNYTYVPMTTREPEDEGNKVYLQDWIDSGAAEEQLGLTLDPARTHFFLCGNPGMIGLPEWDGDEPAFPETRGVAAVLHERGFTLDRRGVAGNVHYEEYW